MLPQDSEDVCEVAHMLGYYFALYNHIINIDFNAPIQLWFEHFGHHPLISKPCIFQPKGQHLVMIVSSRSDKKLSFPDCPVPMVSDDILERHPRNSSKDGLLLHPSTDLSEA